MQQFSFDFRDPIHDVHGLKLGLQVITFENTYGLDPDRTTMTGSGDAQLIRAEGLQWAGGQEKCCGRAELSVRQTPEGVELQASAEMPTKVRCLKVIVSGLPRGRIIGSRWAEQEVPAGGLILGYPRGGLPAPVMFLDGGGGDWIGFRSMDDRVREKRFAIYEVGETFTVELIHEEAGHEMGAQVTTPPWVLTRGVAPEAVIAAHIPHLEKAFGLQPWETRPDVPDWARQISFVAALHCMHWSGYVFNTYAQALDALRWVCERIEGRRVLAFLPGWEGRYYWQYGEYWPHERLGGVEGFRRLVEGAHELGAHVCPMLGGNCANTGLENFEQWGATSHLMSAGGAIFQGNKPDWDVARAHDTGWQAWLNPGAPGWGNRLFDQSARLVEDLGVDALFYDTAGCWTNDPNHPVHDGYLRLRDRLKQRFPELLLTGEHWYSGLGAALPVSHSSVPEQFIEVFSRYNRRWQHLNTGDPSRGSTGVHELGTNPWMLPELREDLWPTVTFVDGTIEEAPERVEQVIELAKQYADRFL